MLRFIFHGLIAGVLTLRLGATPVELTLAAGRRFDVTYALSIGQTTNGRDDLSGRILADVRVTEFDGVSGFKMTGGRIAHQDGTLDHALSSFVHVLFITQGVGSVPMTDDGGGELETGVASNYGHRMIPNEGMVTTRQVVCGSTAGEEVPNLAAQSDNTSLVGTTTLTPTVVIEPALSRAVVQETVATKAPVQWEFSADLGEGDLVAIAGWTHRRGRDG